MMRAVKAVSTYRGRNPADFTLMAFGGNGGIFAAELARQLQMRHVLVPPGAGVFSAIGLCMADQAFGRSRAWLRRVDRIDVAGLNAVLRELEAEVTATLGGAPGVRVRRAAAMRYAGQAFELPVTLPEADFRPADLPALAEAFECEHARSYGHRLTDAAGIETVALEVVASTRPWDGRAPVPGRGGEHSIGERVAYFGPELGAQATPVLRHRRLLAGRTEGPLIIEEYEGTTVVPPGATAWLDGQGNIAIEIGG
jgi:N-methylhydantoinase A